MTKIKYSLENIAVDESKLVYQGKDSKNAVHKAIIVGNGIELNGYAAPTGHVRIVRNNGLSKSNILGGFNFYLNNDLYLVLAGLSNFYGGVPKPVADQFAKLIQRALKKKEIKNKGILIDIVSELSPRWNQYGYREENN